MFANLMNMITPSQKGEISAYIDDFPTSGIELRLSKSAPRYAYSVIHFVAVLLFLHVQILQIISWQRILRHHLDDGHKKLWLSL